MDPKQQIKGILKKYTTGLDEINLEVPPSPELGDYAFPCFGLAKRLKKSPNEIAQELSKKIKISGVIKKIEAKGPYLNFFISKDTLIENTIKNILQDKEKYGTLNIKNKTALIEHTSINPNASPHVGRARNALIGDTLTRVLRFNGYKTEVHYYVNDVGKQIAMLVLAAGKTKPKFEKLLDLYIGINKKVEKNKGLEKEIFTLLYNLENGNKDVRKKFKEIVDICVKGQIKILSELGIKYDYFDYESKYLWNKDCEKILEKLKKTNKLFLDENNRYVLDQKEYGLAMKSPVLVLTRNDKTSLYPLRDLVYNIEKINKKADKNIIVLGEDQKLYFQQIKAALDLLGYKAPDVVHYSFILLKTGKMSTRSGNVVLLENFMKEAEKKAKEEIQKREKTKLTENLTKVIGHGAIKYSILKVSPEKNVIFDLEQALKFEGETGPYVQYAYARICSILKKYGKKIDTKINYRLLNNKEEIELIDCLSEFPNIIKKASEDLRPNIIASYAYELAKKFNDFYEAHRVLDEKEGIKKARLVLILCVKQVLHNALGLLGIETPERM